MFRYFTVFVLFGFAATTAQAQVGVSVCWEEKEFTCAEAGAGYEGECLLNDCNPNGLGEWTCDKPKGLTVNNTPFPRKWWDLIEAGTGKSGSTNWINLQPPLDGCGFVIWCGCDPQNHSKCVDGATDEEFIPDEFRIGTINCVGT